MLRVGERLPPEAELANQFGIAVATLRKALAQLRAQGVVETRRGRNGGSFVRSSLGAVVEVNAQALIDMPRVALADLGVLYEVIAAACAEYACLRATPEELARVLRVLAEARSLPADAWRRRITDVQLELAALSQSVRLTSEHVRVQAEFTPLLALQDIDPEQRQFTQEALTAQIAAIRSGDVAQARAVVRRSIRGSVRWLGAFRTELLEQPAGRTLRDTLEVYRARVEAAGSAGEAA